METIDYIITKYGVKKDRYIYLNITREELASLFAELNFKIGAEIGVEQGLYSEILCKANPKLELYCIDSWQVYEGYKDFTIQTTLDKAEADTRKRLAPYNCHIIKDWSIEAVKKFEDNLLDFVYIDGNHDFQNVTNDIYEWSKKVRKGGIISGHDYVRYRTSILCHVKSVIVAMEDALDIGPIFVVTGDPFNSWFWIKK
jgi:hypothetical protein